MKRRTLLFFVFTICLVILLSIFVLGAVTKSSGFGFVQILLSPVQSRMVSVFHHQNNSEISKLKQDNTTLSQKVAKMHLLEADNKALRDQFATTSPSASSLLPATIIGMPDFLPGVTVPDSLIVSLGTANGVSIGQAVVYKDTLLGTIQNAHRHFSQVQLVTSSSVSFAAKTAKTGALGIVKGLGNGQVELDNVVLSDTLEVGDMVVTSADVNGDGKGFLPGLIIGKITSVDKKPSALFQKAHIQVLVDVTRLPMVFVVGH